MILPRSWGYPVGRDYAEYGPECSVTMCLCNDGCGRCSVPTKAIIGSDGRCLTWVRQRELIKEEAKAQGVASDGS